MYLCFPSNPHGALADIEYLKKAVKMAKKYDFILLLMNATLIYMNIPSKTNWRFRCFD